MCAGGLCHLKDLVCGQIPSRHRLVNKLLACRPTWPG